ncbi:phosphoribosylformylglycinamidine cyclo-ligase [Ottowia sp.]|uniref:phosphoribosylformylglycinamidine cyclo-ligase n=1 Tax=Ottowia sp. TaxID=1898956 RepID=UPI002C7AE9DC|nr:phosphoribosylformylglycinamidine cyclo-ligase [Ottowia sp.]HRN74640.1 phosphoribosylformylglycinamidine cyclo-ligase [Ottowia sp.]HRQ01470.1 phosphoribosylformylglycinamidine cyclo-ligase [Ottowia sp.]
MTSSSAPTPLSYKDAGVDIDAGDALVERIKPLARRTLREGVLSGLGGFGALFEIPKRYQEPVLVSGTDGVGTKLRLAFEWNMHDTVGIDLVAMSVNDVLVQGAEPLFFLDYFACGKLDVDTAAAVVGGIAKGCELAGCALIGGETAEMPGMYPPGEYDLAGFCVGAVEKSKILNGQGVVNGDVVLGLASSGVHSNGFSLVRKCIERAGDQLPATLDGQPFRQAVMQPTRIYVRNVLAALARFPNTADTGTPSGIKALAHITGGGLLENIPRVLPSDLAARLDKGSWPRTELFDWLQRTAGIDDTEMNRTFNNGIGMVVVVAASAAAACADMLRTAGEQVFEIGRIAPRGDGAAVVLA